MFVAINTLVLISLIHAPSLTSLHLSKSLCLSHASNTLPFSHSLPIISTPVIIKSYSLSLPPSPYLPSTCISYLSPSYLSHVFISQSPSLSISCLYPYIPLSYSLSHMFPLSHLFISLIISLYVPHASHTLPLV